MSWIVFLAAIAISLMIFGGLVRIAKATIRTALSIAIVILAMMVLFGIGPEQVWLQVRQIFQTIWRLIFGG